MRIQQYQGGRVPLPGGSTKAQASYQTPVADAIGQAAGVASQFAEKYQQAKYQSDLTATSLEITKRVNAYYEERRRNPILAAEGQDIVALKEADWKKFSQDLQNNYISKLDNPKLSEAVSNSWAMTSEGYRSKVVESAQVADIEYMANKATDDMQTFTDYGSAIIETSIGQDGQPVEVSGYDKAIQIIIDSYESGLYSREGKDDAIEYVNMHKVMEKANKQGSVADQKEYIGLSDLTLESKAKLNKIVDANEAQRQKEKKEWEKQQGETDITDTLLAVSQGKYASVGIYDLEIEQGSHQYTSGEKQQYVRNIIENTNKEDKPSSADRSKFLSGMMSGVFNNGHSTRSDGFAMLEYLAKNYGLTGEENSHFIGMMDSDKYERLNDKVYSYAQEQMDAMEKEGLLGETPTQIATARARMENSMFEMSNNPSLSSAEIKAGVGFTMDDAKQFFKTENGIALGYKINAATLKEPNGNKKITPEERLLIDLGSGMYKGRPDREALDKFIKDETMSDDSLREELSNEYAKSYDKLSKDEKAQVNLTASIGKLYRLTDSTFKSDFPGIDGSLAIDTDTGQPVIESAYKTHRGDWERKIYKMHFNENEKEEQWWSWTKEGGWIIAKDIPDLSKTGLMGSTYNTIIKGAKATHQGVVTADERYSDYLESLPSDIKSDEEVNPFVRFMRRTFGD